MVITAVYNPSLIQICGLCKYFFTSLEMSSTALIDVGAKKSLGGKGGGGGGGSHAERKLEVQKPVTSSRQRTISTSSSTDDHRQHKLAKTSKKATEVIT